VEPHEHHHHAHHAHAEHGHCHAHVEHAHHHAHGEHAHGEHAHHHAHHHKALLLGDEVPDFEAETTLGHIKFYEFIGDHWVIFFSHPADFTPVCTTELGAAARLFPEFEKRNVKVIALSVDTVEHHNQWKLDIEETQQTKVEYPIIGDPERKVAHLYGMLSPNADDTLQGKLTVRTVFFIDPKKKLRASITYPAAVGRNFDELHRVIDALQLTDKYRIATPVNWKKGDDVIVQPSIKNEEAVNLFPKGFKEIKPYYRVTPTPE